MVAVGQGIISHQVEQEILIKRSVLESAFSSDSAGILDFFLAPS